jgi:two-component system, chemotaxis family, chemotaxis protein CheY
VSRNPGKILIVEDSPTMVQLYRIVLGREGTQLVFATTGVEGLDLAAQEDDIDLYIVDINMPQMDGLEFLRRLRGELGVRDTPALVVSTEGEEADRLAAREAGANAYLQKPWTPEQLVTTVREVYAAAAE